MLLGKESGAAANRYGTGLLLSLCLANIYNAFLGCLAKDGSNAADLTDHASCCGVLEYHLLFVAAGEEIRTRTTPAVHDRAHPEDFPIRRIFYAMHDMIRPLRLYLVLRLPPPTMSMLRILLRL